MYLANLPAVFAFKQQLAYHKFIDRNRNHEIRQYDYTSFFILQTAKKQSKLLLTANKALELDNLHLVALKGNFHDVACTVLKVDSMKENFSVK